MRPPRHAARPPHVPAPRCARPMCPPWVRVPSARHGHETPRPLQCANARRVTARHRAARGEGERRRGQRGRTAHCRNRAAGRGRGRACYQTTIDVGLGEMAVAGLDRATLEPILAYCAEQRCARKMRAVRAAGCTWNGSASRPSTISSRGIAEIGFTHSTVRLRGGGSESWRPRAWRNWPRPGPGRSTGSGRGACCASCATASAAPPERRAADGAGDSAGPGPGAPAARRQHRHGRARHGQLRPRGAAPRRPARRLAQREGAHRRLRRQLHHRWGRGLPTLEEALTASTGWRPPAPGSAISPSPSSPPSRPSWRCCGG